MRNLHLFVLLVLSLSVWSQNSFIRHLEKYRLRNEHHALLFLANEMGKDSTDYFRSRFYLLYEEDSLLANLATRNPAFYLRDTLLGNAAFIRLLKTSGETSLFSDELPGSFYGEKMMAAYSAVDKPNLQAFVFLPSELSDEYISYVKASGRKPVVAAGLSAVLPGLGQLYAGRKKSFLFTLATHIIFAARTTESIRKLGWRHPFSLFNLAFSGAFYSANIFGSAREVKKATREKRKQLLMHVADYYKNTCSCTVNF